MKKYNLDTNDTINVNGKTLYRIVALINFSIVTAGDKGGYVESEDNLSQYGDAWVFGNARVYDEASVFDNAHIYGDAWVYSKAEVYGNASVCGDAEVYGAARIYENAEVGGNAQIYGNSQVFGKARIYDDADISENAQIYGDSHVFGNARVSGETHVAGYAQISSDARIDGDKDYFCAQSFGSAGRTTTFFRTENGWAVNCGCFFGTIEEFRKKVKEKHGNSLDAQEYLMIADLMELRIKHVELETKNEVE